MTVAVGVMHGSVIGSFTSQLSPPFFKRIVRAGIRLSDPRLKTIMEMLEALKPLGTASVQDMKLEPQVFQAIVSTLLYAVVTTATFFNALM